MVDMEYIRERVAQAERDAGGQTALAVKWKVSVSYIRDVLNGRRDPGKSILAALGYERVVLYRKIEK
jgi:hypothetical protein